MHGLSNHIDQIKQLCSAIGVKSLFAFGSVITPQFNSESDIDLVVEIEDSDPLAYSDRYFSLKFQLEQLLDRQIDLLESKAIQNPYLKREIDSTKILVYGE